MLEESMDWSEFLAQGMVDFAYSPIGIMIMILIGVVIVMYVIAKVFGIRKDVKSTPRARLQRPRATSKSKSKK